MAKRTVRRQRRYAAFAQKYAEKCVQGEPPTERRGIVSKPGKSGTGLTH